MPIKNPKDYTGVRKGKLTLLFKTGDFTKTWIKGRNGKPAILRKAEWAAQCDCGDYISVDPTGSYSKCHKCQEKYWTEQRSDYAGQTHNGVKFISSTSKIDPDKKSFIWKIGCSCGNIFYDVPSKLIKLKHPMCPDCLEKSGETIEKIRTKSGRHTTIANTEPHSNKISNLPRNVYELKENGAIIGYRVKFEFNKKCVQKKFRFKAIEPGFRAALRLKVFEFAEKMREELAARALNEKEKAIKEKFKSAKETILQKQSDAVRG